MPEQPPQIICGLCRGTHSTEMHAQYALDATDLVGKKNVEVEPDPEKNVKYIFDQMIFALKHKTLLQRGNYQGNAMWFLQKAYEEHSTFLGESIPEQLYLASIDVDRRIQELNQQVDRQVYDVDSLLRKINQKRWDLTLLVNACLKGVVTKDELKRVMEERKKILETPEWSQKKQEFEAFAQRVNDEYFDFLDSSLARAKKEDLTQLEHKIFADLRRVEIDNRSQGDVTDLNVVLRRIQRHLNRFEDRAADERKREQRFSVIIEKIKAKYNISETPPQLLAQLYTADKAFGGLENLNGKRILDLGCGSTVDGDSLQLMEAAAAGDSQARREIIKHGMYDLFINYRSNLDSLGHRLYEPWFCRALLELNAKPVGIDVGNLDGEVFEHYKLDLSKVGALDFLTDRSFDAVNMRQLFSSPQLEYTESQHTEGKMEEELKKQLRRLLKSDGKVLSVHFRR